MLDLRVVYSRIRSMYHRLFAVLRILYFLEIIVLAKIPNIWLSCLSSARVLILTYEKPQLIIVFL